MALSVLMGGAMGLGISWMTGLLSEKGAPRASASGAAVATDAFQAIFAEIAAAKQSAAPVAKPAAPWQKAAVNERAASDGQSAAGAGERSARSGKPPGGAPRVASNPGAKQSSGRGSRRSSGAPPSPGGQVVSQPEGMADSSRCLNVAAAAASAPATAASEPLDAPAAADPNSAHSPVGAEAAPPASGKQTMDPAAVAALGDLSGVAFALHVAPADGSPKTASSASPSSVASTGSLERSASSASAVVKAAAPPQPSTEQATQGMAAPQIPYYSADGFSNFVPNGKASDLKAGQNTGRVAAATGSVGLSAAQNMLGSGWTPGNAGAPSNGMSAREAVPASAPVAEPVGDDEVAPGQPVKTVHVQLAGADRQRVDLRLVEHAGGLSVSVRATDSFLTRGLQERLPELSARLEAEQYRTQTFVPAANPAAASPETESGRQPGQADQGPTFGGGSSAGSGQQQERRRKDEPQASWRRALSAGKAAR